MARRFLFLSLSLSTLLLAGCWGGNPLPSHGSASGLMPESYIPSDVNLVVSFSTQNEAEWAAIQALDAKTVDENAATGTDTAGTQSQQSLLDAFVQSFKGSLADSGVDYDRDLKPAFGDQFRLVHAEPAVEGTSVGQADAGSESGLETSAVQPSFTVVTLKDAVQMDAVFKTLVSTKKFTEQVRSDRTLYFNPEKKMYFTLEKDLLLAATSPEALLGMLDLSKGASLWDLESYQKNLKDVTDDFLFYVISYPQKGAQAGGLAQVPSGISADLTADQILLLRAEDEGLRFTAYVHGDKAKAKERGVAFDSIPHAKSYLFDQVPADRLVAYFESYGLKQSFEQGAAAQMDATALNGLKDGVRRFLAMDFDKDILSFFDKGYVLALHRSAKGVIPGASLFVDVSSDMDHAKELVDKIDAQIAGFTATYEAVLPGAFTRKEIPFGGEKLKRVSLDLAAISRSQAAPLPASIVESPVQLTYGIVGNRLLISNADVWAEGAAMVSKSDLYEKLSGHLSGVDEGLILMDSQELSQLLQDLSSLREQLALEVPQQMTQFTAVLSHFVGFIGESHTNAYDTTLSGFLLLR